MDVLRLVVGEFQTNSYVLICQRSYSLVVDPGGNLDGLLAALADTRVEAILLTHGHVDHTGALAALREATGARVGVHPSDASMLPLAPDLALVDGLLLEWGACHVRVHHLPGHTPGSVALELDGERWLVGDAIFPGGPGHTDSPADFAQLLQVLWQRVFVLPLQTQLLPGHGEATTVGRELDPFHAFLRRGWAQNAYGDVRWDSRPGVPGARTGNA